MSAGLSLAAFAEGFAGSRRDRKAREERAADAARQDRMLDWLESRPQQSTPVPGMVELGAAPASGRDAGGGAFPASLIQSESGGNWQALNSEGYGGRLQFGAARLADAARAGVIPEAIDGAAFSRLPPEQQQAVEKWHFADIDRNTDRLGLTKYIGQEIGGTQITRDGIRAMAHLGGMGGVKRYLESGGRHNPADSNRTSLADYARRHGGAPNLNLGAQPPVTR